MAGKIMLETERLLLREHTEDDAEAFHELNKDPEVTRYTGDGGPRTVEEMRAILRTHPIADYARHGYGRWACVLKESGELIGFAGLKYLPELGEVDVGYRLRRNCWGRGLATEAARATLAYGFDRLKLERIIGLVDPDNA